MPIEIKELQIKAVVAPEPGGRSDSISSAMLEKIKKEILRDCLREIKTLLKEQKER